MSRGRGDTPRREAKKPPGTVDTGSRQRHQDKKQEKAGLDDRMSIKSLASWAAFVKNQNNPKPD